MLSHTTRALLSRFSRGLTWTILALALTAPTLVSAESYVAIGKYEEGEMAARSLDRRSTDAMVQRYRAAIADAEFPTPDDISRNLQAIVPWEPGLIWQPATTRYPAGRVLLVTWTSYTGYDSLVGQETTASRDIWVSLEPTVQNFCRRIHASPDRVTLRMEQLMGLPPYGGKTRFVQFWVNPQDLFRPSADPTITDHEAELDFPVSAKFMAVNPSFITWYVNLESISYDPITGYPWTRLGYTYDWKPGTSKIGLAEFVIPAGTQVGVNAVILNNDYFYRPR